MLSVGEISRQPQFGHSSSQVADQTSSRAIALWTDVEIAKQRHAEFFKKQVRQRPEHCGTTFQVMIALSASLIGVSRERFARDEVLVPLDRDTKRTSQRFDLPQ